MKIKQKLLEWNAIFSIFFCLDYVAQSIFCDKGVKKIKMAFHSNNLLLWSCKNLAVKVPTRRHLPLRLGTETKA